MTWVHPPIVSWTILVSQVSCLVLKCCTVSHDKPWICGSWGCPMRSPRPRLGDLHYFLFHFFGGFRGRWSLRCLAGDDGWWSQLLRGESCIPHPKEVLGVLQFWHVRYGLTMVYIDTVPNQFSSRSLVTLFFVGWTVKHQIFEGCLKPTRSRFLGQVTLCSFTQFWWVEILNLINIPGLPMVCPSLELGGIPCVTSAHPMATQCVNDPYLGRSETLKFHESLISINFSYLKWINN